MHRILVEEKKWVSEHRFLHALNYCMLLPGPEAQQLSIYIGWLLHGTAGGLTAGTLFILPGFLSIMLLSILYAGFQSMGFVQALFYGIKPAVVAIVVEAVLRIGKRAVKNGTMASIAVSAFVAIFFFQIPFPWIVVTAGTIGFLGGRLSPERFVVLKGHGSPNAPGDAHPATDAHFIELRPSWGRALRIVSIWSCLWFTPIVLLVWFAGIDSIYTQEALFFSQTAVVTFGGAYAVLSYIAQECVNRYGWLQPGEMLDGLGMAETTPGPLIQVVQFVGFMGAYRNPGPFDPMIAGVFGAVITTWVTFVPCFLWIFVGAPYIESLRGHKSLNAALSAVTAAVVGVVLNLSLWFTLHTLFGTVTETQVYGLRLLIPDWSTLDAVPALLAAGSFVAIFRYKLGMFWTIGISTIIGMSCYLLSRN